jgi:hypothetical protein
MSQSTKTHFMKKLSLSLLLMAFVLSSFLSVSAAPAANYIQVKHGKHHKKGKHGKGKHGKHHGKKGKKGKKHHKNRNAINNQLNDSESLDV